MPSRSIREINGEELEKVSIKDLTWEDKELVLRVLFSKMNGNNQAAKANTDINTNGRSQKRGGGGRPVFVSEGNYGDAHAMAEAEQYQYDNFEIHSDQQSNSSSRAGTANSDGFGLMHGDEF